jgi:hypothetical protein
VNRDIKFCGIDGTADSCFQHMPVSQDLLADLDFGKSPRKIAHFPIDDLVIGS